MNNIEQVKELLAQAAALLNEPEQKKVVRKKPMLWEEAREALATIEKGEWLV